MDNYRNKLIDSLLNRLVKSYDLTKILNHMIKNDTRNYNVDKSNEFGVFRIFFYLEHIEDYDEENKICYFTIKFIVSSELYAKSEKSKYEKHIKEIIPKDKLDNIS